MLQARCILVLLILANWSTSWSEVTLDGTQGSSGTLDGPNFQITEDLGRRAGSNLYHSFGSFNLNRAESATFSGSSGINNVISRVTGGSPSSIDGALRSTIPNANLYFLNPAGVIFGENASLDVQGSFHLSTADYLGLADGTRFSAVSPSDNQVLTTASPEAFGFLGDNPSAITLAQAELKVPSGESLSVIGGDINLDGGELIALGGRIDIASVSSKGEVARQDNNLNLNGFNQLGKIELTQSAKVDASGEGGGAIFIRGGELTLNESEVRSDTLGGGRGKNVDIRLPQGALELGNGGVIRAFTKGAGKSGDLFIESRNIFLSNKNGAEFGTSLFSGSTSSGDGGDIKVKTESLELVDGATIASVALDAGNGGDVFIEADSVKLSGVGPDAVTAISTFTQSSGNAGDLTIKSNSLEVADGALVVTTTSDSGKGGIVSVDAEKVIMTGSKSSVSAFSFDKGDSQDIIIKTGSLEVRDGAVIANFSPDSGGTGKSTGKSADLLIEARDIVLTSNEAEPFTGILGGSFNDVDSGNVSIITENLEIRGGSTISTKAKGTGRGGDILVTAEDILLAGHDSAISSSAAINSSGDAGNIIIQADHLELQGTSRIITSTFGTGDGGDLLVTAGNILMAGGSLNSDSLLDSSGDAVDSFIGDAGDIFIKSDNLVMRSPVKISSSTNSTGKGGDITIEAGNILLTGKDTGISASTLNAGNAGNVTLITDNLELRNETKVLAFTNGSGAGGNLLVTAGNIVLSDSSNLSADVNEDGSGNAGKVTIQADNLAVRSGSRISSSTLGAGNAGKVDIKTNQLDVRKGSTIDTLTSGFGDGGDVIVKAGNILLSGDGSADITGIVAIRGDDDVGDGDTGDAGDVTIVSTHLDIRDGAVIETSTIGAGKGGNISIEGRTVRLSGDGSSRNTGLFSRSLDIGDNAGNAGRINITTDDSLRILDGASISVETETADAGNINIEADSLLQLSDSKITTSVADGKGNGGNIIIGQNPNSKGTIHTPNLTLLDNGNILANANEGKGGNISISSDFIIRSENSKVTASSNEGGIDGTVNINSPETNISGSIIALPETFINASEHLSERCAARSANLSSFVVKDRGGIPPGPEDSAFSTYFENDQQRRFANDTMASRDWSIVNNRLVTATADSFISRVSRENNTTSVLTEYDCGE
ncbi:MAG: filamentous hemagglutinin N-terminal domain-containing protein [Methylococcales bacterium]